MQFRKGRPDWPVALDPTHLAITQPMMAAPATEPTRFTRASTTTTPPMDWCSGCRCHSHSEDLSPWAAIGIMSGHELESDKTRTRLKSNTPMRRTK